MMNELSDIDLIQTKEWLDSIDNVIDYNDPARAKFLLTVIAKRLKDRTDINIFSAINTEYINTYLHDLQYPGNIDLEQKIEAYIRWNATVMVLRANKISTEIGGHIASYASSASLYEVGFNHFWRAKSDNNTGDLVFFQGHCSPGIYARSFLEGRFDIARMDNFRQESHQLGLSSYPHPWLMPDYWQFPTVSMGLGPLMAIYQARFMKYLEDRTIIKPNKRKVWCFVGDGETSENETLGNIHIAARENLDNLIFVINCNLQRLDGPVNGNGKIIQELEALFNGAQWKVIKIIWGSGWDRLLAADTNHKLQQIMMTTVDGEYQTYRSRDGAYIREKFFAKDPEALILVQDLSDEQIWELTRGGHDLHKIYTAYRAAIDNNEIKPVVILAHTIKGYGMKGEGESQNIAHQQKKLSHEALLHMRDKFKIPLSDQEIEQLPYIKFETQSPEYLYLQQQRQQLGGYYPMRKILNETLIIPELSVFANVINASGTREISTTMAFVRILNTLIKDPNLGKRIVPIVPDESRTFGMEGMFRQLGIWSHIGQLYTPEDVSQLMYYKEDAQGQIFQEGINEAGAMCTWIAAATSYANNNISMIPFYIYYSMFGFQRIGDLAWAAGDMMARGFLLGGTAGRTTLNGEGLQHQDGHSQIQANLIPNCESYDPTFAYEVAVIIQHGLQEMYVQHQNKYYYLTLMNENYPHPAMPENSAKGIIQGCYLFQQVGTGEVTINLMASGTILREAIAAAELLQQDFALTVNIYSTTSYNKLYRAGMEVNRYNLLHQDKKISYLSELLSQSTAIVTVAASDYLRSYANQIREFVSGTYIVLGTDGFGRSDYRSALREFFEVNRYYIVVAALSGLVDAKLLPLSILNEAITRYNIDVNKQNPWEV